MLNKLTLTNFRQHTNLVVNFTQGLNVIRGANEAGKSTTTEAVGYAFYGSRALNETLDSVVTWGQPESTLRVELEFTHNGTQGMVKRGKSGAECKYGDTLITGQAEVTKFFEQLFRTNAATAANLQIASQNKVRGAVAGGGQQAVQLIETLADFSLLEQVIELVQAKRPYGNPAPLLAQLEVQKAALEAPLPPAPDATPVHEAEAALTDAAEAAKEAQDRTEALNAAAAAATRRIRIATDSQARATAAAERIPTVRAELAVPAPEQYGTESDAFAWEGGLGAVKDNATRLKHFKVGGALVTETWAGTRQQFEARVKELNEAYSRLQQTKSTLSKDVAVAKSMAINEKSCAFCKKDLSEVPEVALRNAEVDAKVKELSEALAKTFEELEGVEAELVRMSTFHDADRKREVAFHPDYWHHNLETMPRTVSWIGEAPFEGEQPDYQGMLQKHQASRRAIAAWQAKQTSMIGELERLQQEVSAAIPRDSADDEAVDAAQAHSLHVAKLQAAEQVAWTKLQAASALYSAQVRAETEAKQQKAEAEASIKEAELVVKQMGFYNELIRKVRAARPAVANKLWSVVLAAVSHYTALGRAQPSLVTRDGDGFKINGKSIAGYSGSAQDVLGLAVRIALLKTFLPGTPFLILDEVAAACDDARELDLLGMLIAADIPQILLVTHSDAAETFASNLIQL